MLVMRMLEKVGVMFFKGFFKNTQALAAMEFALVLPVMMLLFYGSFETLQFLSFQRRLQSAAGSITRFISEVTPDSPDVKTYTMDITEWQYMVNLVPFYVPEVLSNAIRFGTQWERQFTLDIMYINVTKNPATNRNEPRIQWVVGGTAFKPTTTCQLNPLPLRPHAYPFDWTTYPAPLNNIGDKLIVQLSMPYRPVLASIANWIPGFKDLTSVTVNSFNSPRYVESMPWLQQSGSARPSFSANFSCP